MTEQLCVLSDSTGREGSRVRAMSRLAPSGTLDERRGKRYDVNRRRSVPKRDRGGPALTLGVFEVGLRWSIVFGKRAAFRKAFRDFDVAKVAAMTKGDVDRLVQDASIIRNRAKIQATVENARAMRSASPSLAALARSYASTRKRAPRSLADLPASTPQADAFAKQLKSQGYRPTAASEPPTTSRTGSHTWLRSFAR